MADVERRLCAKGCVKVNLLIDPANARMQGFHERLGTAQMCWSSWASDSPGRDRDTGQACMRVVDAASLTTGRPSSYNHHAARAHRPLCSTT